MSQDRRIVVENGGVVDEVRGLASRCARVSSGSIAGRPHKWLP